MVPNRPRIILDNALELDHFDNFHYKSITGADDQALNLKMHKKDNIKQLVYDKIEKSNMWPYP